MAEVLNDINNDTRTVIGLRHLDEIKAYVDGRIGEVSGEVTEEINEYLQNQLDAAKDKIEKDTEDKLKDLKDKLDQAILEGDESAIRDLQLKIDVITEDLSTKFEALDAINDELDRINGKYGDLSNSIFTPGEIDELIKTAFIDGTYITNDSVTAPNVFTTKLVALIAKFGKIKAANIEAGAITGHTISCDNLDKNGMPMWSLNEDGSGNIAGDNITWDKNGKVELGEDVTFSWKSVDNTGNPALDKLNKLENAQNDLKDIVNNGFQNIVSGWIEDGNLNPTEIKAIKSELEKITSNYKLLNKYLDEIIDIYATAKNNDIDKEVKTKYYEDLKVAKKKLSDAYADAKSVCEYYINANGNSIGTIKLNAAYDLDKINKYYEVQNEVTLFYQEANSFYTTDNRFGSKLTYIGEDGIYSGKIMGDQITGLQIRGLTVEGASTTKLPDYINWKKYTDEFDKNGNPIFDSMKGGFGPTWQIAEDGTGYLGAGTMSWHDNKIILGPDTEITWASVKDGDAAVDDMIDDKLKNVKDNISNISKIMDDFNERMRDFDNQMHDLATDVGNIGEGGGGDWPTPDMGKIDEALEKLEDLETTLGKDYVYSKNGIFQNVVGNTFAGINMFAGKGTQNAVTGVEPSAFGVYENGNGFLADGAFKWYKENGEWKVKLGKGVTIDWDSTGNNGPIPPQIDDDGEPIDVQSVVNATELGAYNIGSGIIAGNLIQGRNDIVLEEGTRVYRITKTEDSAYIEEDPTVADGSTDKGPSWQIHGSTGEGYLAAGHIRWDVEGKLHANVNGTFSGGNDGGVGEGVMTWDKDNIYIKKNLVFEENSTISWSDSTKPEAGDGGITNEEFKEKLTSIGPTWITTQEIDGTQITGKTITGEQIDADTLTVKQLDTQGNGRVTIFDKNIKVYDENNPTNPILTISGEELNTSSNGKASVTINYYEYSPYKNNGTTSIINQIGLKYQGSILIGEIVVPDDNFNISANNFNISFTCNRIFGETGQTDGSISYNSDILINTNYNSCEELIDPGAYNVSIRDTGDSKSQSSRIYFNDNDITNSQTTISKGTYYIWYRYLLNASDIQNSNEEKFLRETALTMTADFSNMNISVSGESESIQNLFCDISPSGFRYFTTNNNYVKFEKNGNIILRNGKNGLLLDTDGDIWMGFNNMQTNTDTDSFSGEDKNSEYGLTMYKVTPFTAKFKLKGKNRKLTVLTLGDAVEIEDF